MSNPTPIGHPQRYATIVADCPWQHPRREPKADARRRYQTMPLSEICALPVADLADPAGAHLWLWAINGLLEDAYTVCRAWGFQPINLVTWCKPGPGLGAYVRTNTEHCILATRGHARIPAHKAMSSWYVWPRGAHSEKPDAFYDLVEQVSPGPRLEMFARRARLGDWAYWGDQSLETAELVA